MELEIGPGGRFVSYAQNGEDVVLLRALGAKSNGFWIDVGANHPVEDSVTKIFSHGGWTGINIEPLDDMFALLAEMRPNEINRQIAISDVEGELLFYRNVSNGGLSTFDKSLIGPYLQRGDVIEEIIIPVTTLTAVCDSLAAVPVIDFLKIDAEGHELNVVRGHDFEKYPVRVICAECSLGALPALTAALNDRGFDQIQFDGLNAWYVDRSESDEVRSSLQYPASPILDFFHRAEYVQLERSWKHELSNSLAQQAEIAELRSELEQLREQVRVLSLPKPSFARRVKRKIWSLRKNN